VLKPLIWPLFNEYIGKVKWLHKPPTLLLLWGFWAKYAQFGEIVHHYWIQHGILVQIDVSIIFCSTNSANNMGMPKGQNLSNFFGDTVSKQDVESDELMNCHLPRE